jgi:protein phosphatase 1 regulatory subunit 42
LAEFYDDRHAAAAISGISTSPELRAKFLALDASAPANNATLTPQHGHGLQQSTHGSSSALDSMGALMTAAQPGGPSMQQTNAVDLANMTRNLSEMSLESSQGPLALNMSTGDLIGHLSSGGPSHAPSMYAMHGIASSGSLGVWPSQGAAGQMSLGSSPVGTGMWPNQSALAMQDMLLAQQQMTAAALIQQQQQQQQQQSQVVHAALQQAMLTQQVAAAALGLHAGGPHPGFSNLTGSLGMPRRGFSEPVLGGRLARRPMDPSAEAERRAQQDRLYGLDLTRISAGEDKRTTLMIKNIPNKYTQKMLLALMEERFAGVTPFPFDFFYLPIDFKNRCNVGYAFINMTSPAAIPALVEEFHGRRWPKFNSEKVCAVAYARIQGKNALVQHFQNSSLLHEDKRCRPVLFGPNGEAELFPIISPQVTGPGLAGFSMVPQA